MHWLDITIIFISLPATVTIGLWFAHSWRNSDEYFLAGRNLPWPLIGFSLFATNISTEHFVELAEGGYAKGLVVGGYEWIASWPPWSALRPIPICPSPGSCSAIF